MDNILHEGKRLKFLVKISPIKARDVAIAMNYKKVQSLAYYYNQPFVKKETLYKFLEILQIDENAFYNKKDGEIANIVEEETITYVTNKTYHQGKNLRNLLDNRFINITALCDKLNLNRANFYSYFKEPTLPEWLTLQVATILDIPTTRITGENVAETKFDKLVYNQLNEINAKLDKIILRK